ncbi:hypothetical protein [Streptomyces bohaiensis]|uniref:hypothetical protein n=1 Tax=Streptomyces bohaiensis TaxID=1431344 RepID=UPI003B81F3D6
MTAALAILALAVAVIAIGWRMGEDARARTAHRVSVGSRLMWEPFAAKVRQWIAEGERPDEEPQPEKKGEASNGQEKGEKPDADADEKKDEEAKPGEPEGWRWGINWAGLGRGLFLAVVAYFAVVKIVDWRWPVPIGAAVWLLSAWWAGRPREGDEDQEQKPTAEEPSAAPEAASPNLAADPLVTILWHLMGTAPGVHLSAVAARLSDGPGRPRVTGAHVRPLVEELGLPVLPRVRGHKRGQLGASTTPSTGVSRADLEKLVGPKPDPLPWSVVKAVAACIYTGQSGVATRSGGEATAVATPEEGSPEGADTPPKVDFSKPGVTAPDPSSSYRRIV